MTADAIYTENVRLDLENVLVVKIGGGAGLDMRRCVADLAELARQRPLVVVHGVSDAVNRLCAERDIPVRTLVSPTGHSSRYTDARTRDVFVEAAGNISEQLCADLGAYGLCATVINDAVQGERKRAIRAVFEGRVRMVRDDYSGSIAGVNVASILEALRRGCVPVLPPLATSADGALNIDGDRASAAIAQALGAQELVILSNVRGLYRSFPDESTFVNRIRRDECDQAMNWADGRMKRKVLGAVEALDGGVRRVVIADGRADHPVAQALNGAGTEFVS